jgi:type III secretion system FlhB-like substrate exporter
MRRNAPVPAMGETVRTLMAQARRRGIVVDDEMPIAGFLQALDDDPLVPHRLMMVAGAVLAHVFRHERELSQGDRSDRDRPSTDCSF